MSATLGTVLVALIAAAASIVATVLTVRAERRGTAVKEKAGVMEGYDDLLRHYLAAVKQLEAKVTEQEGKVRRLEEENDAQANELRHLHKMNDEQARKISVLEGQVRPKG